MKNKDNTNINMVNPEEDFTIYHPTLFYEGGDEIGHYKTMGYSFRGTCTSFSDPKDILNFIKESFLTEEECERVVKGKNIYRDKEAEDKRYSDLIRSCTRIVKQETIGKKQIYKIEFTDPLADEVSSTPEACPSDVIKIDVTYDIKDEYYNTHKLIARIEYEYLNQDVDGYYSDSISTEVEDYEFDVNDNGDIRSEGYYSQEFYLQSIGCDSKFDIYEFLGLINKERAKECCRYDEVDHKFLRLRMGRFGCC